jgi:hypothetical protein
MPSPRGPPARGCRNPAAAAVDRDRHVEQHLVAQRGEVRLEAPEQLGGARRGREEPQLDLLRRRELDELLLEGPREAAAAQVPAVELLQEARRAPLAQLPHGLADEEDELGGDLLPSRLLADAVDDLPQCPRVPLRAAPDHHGRRARGREHGLRPRARRDVARGDHRHVDQVNELGGQTVVGLARVHLPRRARVERERLRSRLDEPRADLEACSRAVLEPPPHLHADRDLDRLGDRTDDPRGPVRVVEQRRARACLRHLPHGAAEVDVDEVCAGGLHHPRGVGHHPRLRAEDLDRERVLVSRHAQVPERARVPVLDPGAADHLRADEAGPEPAALAAERLHAHARHRCEDEARRDLHRSDAPGLPKIYLHRPGNCS